MYCNKCGKHIDEDSVFCQFCGNKVNEGDLEIPESKSTTEEKSTEPVKTVKEDILWDKFAEVYDAEGEDRTKFDALSSPYIWELLERLSVNRFENFIEEHKEELNKQPYKSIEALKNVFRWTGVGGYRLWLAEALLDDKEELNKFKSFSIDKMVEIWKEYDFDKATKGLSDEMGVCITKYSNFRINTFMDNAPEAKELSNAVVEELRTTLLFHTVNGYHAGTIENTFRK